MCKYDLGIKDYVNFMETAEIYKDLKYKLSNVLDIITNFHVRFSSVKYFSFPSKQSF